MANQYPNLKPEDDDVGDTNRFDSPDVHNHYHSPPKKGLGTLAKLAIGAGLLGSGVGAGVGIPLLIDALKSQPVIEKPISSLEIRDWKLGTPTIE